MREPSERQRRIEHRGSWELLPWLVNGSLSDAQAQRLENHLRQCAECRREHAEQLQVRQQMQSEESLLHTPHASLRKLMARIEHDEVAAPAETDKRIAVSSPRRVRWLTLAVAAQFAGLMVLAGALWWRIDADRSAPRYSTLSSAPAAVARAPAARVVFSPSLSLAELDKLLHSYNAQVAAGPSDAGVYTLVFPAARDPKEVAAAVVQLRARPEVRFAELAVTDFGAGM